MDKSEEARYRMLMAQHQYFGDLAKTGNTLWYFATDSEALAALLTVLAALWNAASATAGSDGASASV
ncbi:hypothetical protein [Accumulibacter sp.]|uniref:hypothetical protein n=1 Tax=Accumulibacter sp. TaxID=2053492 RepID=UPI001DED7BCC|nr:hypothetical protein [Accumulibacter sp.]MCB1966263.1 hypothetical protein [Accumulibacter sp.]MCP5229678.1 hypothetical protein [Accumulibacter sp.]